MSKAHPENQVNPDRPWETLTKRQPRSSLKTHIVPAGHGFAWEVRASSHFRVVDLHGQQITDFMAWAAPYSRATNSEHFSTSYTRFALGGPAPPEVGESLYSNADRPMFTLIADTVKVHDMQFCACNPGLYHRIDKDGHRSCATNIAEAMAPYGMKHWTEVVSPFNIFQNTPYFTLKALSSSKPGDYIEFKAEMDAICAVSSCPYEEHGVNGGKSTDIAIVTEVDPGHEN